MPKQSKRRQTLQVSAILRSESRATFRRRATALPAAVPVALSEAFASHPMKLRQWQAFVKRGRLRLYPEPLPLVVEAMRVFLLPALDAAVEPKKFHAHWPKGGPWTLKA